MLPEMFVPASSAASNWRGARVVDWDGLENRSRCKPTVGSNPTPSVGLCHLPWR